MPSPFSYYDDLRKDDPSNFSPVYDGSAYVGRNLHRYKKENSEEEVQGVENSEGEQEEVVLCHVPTFVRYTKDGKDYSAAGYGSGAGSILAVQHWNTGNGVIVKEIEDIHKTCPIRFTTEIFDTQSNAVPAVKGLTDMLIRKPNEPQYPQPCAIVGTIYSSVSTKFAITSGVYDLLQVAPGASSDALDDRKQYPLFSRTHPADGGSALLLPKYLDDVMKIKNFAIVYIADDGFGLSYLQVVQEYAKTHGMNTISVPISFNPMPTKEEIKYELRNLLDAELNYVIAILFFDNHKPIMEAAGELGVAGPGKFWFFAGSLSDYLYENAQEFEKGSVLAKATYGSAIITDGGAAPGTVEYERFLKEWNKLGDNAQTLEYINSKQPLSPASNSSLSFNRTKDFFHRTPNHIAIYSYEAMIGIGLAACQAAKEAKSNFTDGNIFSGQEHHKAFLDINFGSASGRVVIGPTTYSRNETSTYFVVANILESQVHEDDSKVLLRGKDHVFFDPSDSEWKSFEGATEFIYSDESTIKPSEVPEAETNLNLISTSVRTSCIVLSCVIITISLGFLIYVMKQWNNRVIKLAQPPFLILICVGTLFMAMSIIPLSLDNGVSFATQGVLDLSCSLTQWFFSFGFTITFAALFSKLWRTNQVLNVNQSSYRRVTIKITDVLRPFAALALCNVIILSVWQWGNNKPKWVRTVLQRNKFDQVTSSLGFCSNHGVSGIPYLVSLITVNGVALILACYQAYIGRNVLTELNESKFIGMAMICICECCFFALPLLFITGSNRSGLLFVFTSICFVICISTLFFIFIPKIIRQMPSSNRHSSSSNPSSVFSSNQQNSNRTLGRSMVSGVSQRLLDLRASQMHGSVRISLRESIRADMVKKQQEREGAPLRSSLENRRSRRQKLESLHNEFGSSRSHVKFNIDFLPGGVNGTDELNGGDVELSNRRATSSGSSNEDDYEKCKDENLDSFQELVDIGGEMRISQNLLSHVSERSGELENCGSHVSTSYASHSNNDGLESEDFDSDTLGVV